MSISFIMALCTRVLRDELEPSREKKLMYRRPLWPINGGLHVAAARAEELENAAARLLTLMLSRIAARLHL